MTNRTNPISRQHKMSSNLQRNNTHRMIIPSKSERHLQISNVPSKSRGNTPSIEKIRKRTGAEHRHIRFNNIVTVQETIHINDLSYDERVNSWYSTHEYQQIREGVSAIITAVQSGTYEGDTDNECLRGLECRLKKNSLRRKKIRLHGIMAVLGEQEEQDITGKYDARVIAQEYMSTTWQSLALAHKIALLDEAEVNDYQMINTSNKTTRKDKSIRQNIMSRIHRREKRRENVD